MSASVAFGQGVGSLALCASSLPHLPAALSSGNPLTSSILGSKNQDTRCLPVHDLRGRFGDFELDRNGFQVVKLESAEKGFGDDERIRRWYYPEIEALVRGV